MKDLIEIAKEAGGSHRPTYELVSFTVTELAKFAELLAKRNAEPVAWRHKEFPSEMYGDLEEFEHDFGDTKQAEPLYLHPTLPAEQDAELITKLTLALQLAKDMFIANGLDLPNTMEVINEALAIANRKDGV
jgi:hypothetical protein